jgi:hypothetical protein
MFIIIITTIIVVHVVVCNSLGYNVRAVPSKSCKANLHLSNVRNSSRDAAWSRSHFRYSQSCAGPPGSNGLFRVFVDANLQHLKGVWTTRISPSSGMHIQNGGNRLGGCMLQIALSAAAA